MNVEKILSVADEPTLSQHNATEDADHWGLVARAKAGCSTAFGKLYERHRLRVYRTILRVVRQREDAEDGVQRCFQRAFTNIATFRGESKFSAWIGRIAINEALMLLRQRNGKLRLAETSLEERESDPVMDLAAEAPTPEQILVSKEFIAALVQAISDLRKNLQSVVLLRELQGLTNEETAQRLGVTVACVKARVFHARRWLRRRLERKLKLAEDWFGD
jgi:RNA polymerase sigma-70 factor (ECF subfamily)